MSFFNKVFASVGIGAASVDTKLEKTRYAAGERVSGIVEVKGGSVEQEVDSIYLMLYTTYIRESDDKKYTDSACIEKVQISEPFVIKANETRQFPVSFELPCDTPVTVGNTRVWVATGLDIKNAVDPKDKDYIDILPNDMMKAVFTSLERLGFKLRKADCEQAPRHLRGKNPFVQEFEFVPSSGAYRSRLDELEVVFLNQSISSLTILFEVDRKARGFGGFLAEALEMDESLVKMTISTSDIPVMDEKITKILDQFS
ncbi:sporulation protein [Rossellomorea vietnamensis]|uniref:Sporulation protein n=2 Tax=Rossellomorea TaxID=2837508 RepID=A0A5D4KH36_9BACI|nr:MULTISPECIES: sporulation protein [Rossellomorea]TYR76577.1 sporulation protein [Rossellomorea vietnamensis]TYS79401.1 sporulation protein [Rossellomorea aquimaris]